MADNPVFVDKKRYDILLRQYMACRDKLENLTNAWNDMKERTTKFDDRVLEDIHRFESLQEENAYIIGSFNTMLAMKYDIEELEEAYHVKVNK